MTRLLLLLFFSVQLSSCYLVKAYRVRNFKLTDHEKLPSVPVKPGSDKFSFKENGTAPAWLKQYLDTSLENSYTAAFLVIKNQSILYERYFNGFDKSSLLPSFSVAKSFVSALVGFAIDEGKIGSVNDPITKYLPELLKTDAGYANITLQHLLDMHSGLHFNEGGYNLKDDAIRLGFRPNLLKHVKKVEIEKAPGGAFEYQSINTELLALAVERATGKKVSAYLQEKIWGPLGMEYAGTWNVDSKKHKQEIAFAGLNATARDFAKFGQLYMNGGSWNGKQLLSKSWVDAVTHPDSILGKGYKNQWWLTMPFYTFQDLSTAEQFKKTHPYSSAIQSFGNNYRIGANAAPHAVGILNQFIYIFPDNDVIIVRLGRHWSHPQKRPNAFIYELGTKL